MFRINIANRVDFVNLRHRQEYTVSSYWWQSLSHCICWLIIFRHIWSTRNVIFLCKKFINYLQYLILTFASISKIPYYISSISYRMLLRQRVLRQYSFCILYSLIKYHAISSLYSSIIVIFFPK